MNDEQISLVQESFKSVIPIKDQAADLFYDRLFELDPSLRTMFKDDMNGQKQALIKILATAVAKLRELDELVPVVEELGRRHVGYGVTTAHYDTVGQALIDTLKKAFGPSWTAPLEEAWLAAYTTLHNIMANVDQHAPAT